MSAMDEDTEPTVDRAGTTDLTTAFEGLLAGQLARIASLHEELADLRGTGLPPMPEVDPVLADER